LFEAILLDHATCARAEFLKPLYIDLPDGDAFALGAPVRLAGTADDDEDGPLDADRLSWKVMLQRGAEVRQIGFDQDAAAITFTVPAGLGTGMEDGSRVVATLSAIDSLGSTAVVTQELLPARTTVELLSEPPGLTLLVDGVAQVTPYSHTAWAGTEVALAASDQADGEGRCYAFTGWSSGADAAHVVAADGGIHTATFRPVTASLASAGIEVAEDAGQAELIVRLDAPVDCQVTLAYQTRDGSARSGEDYENAAEQLSIPPGTAEKTIVVPLVDDERNEDPEQFEVLLDEFTGAAPGAITAAQVTIRDDDPPPTLGFTQTNVQVAEAAGEVRLTARLDAPSGKAITVGYQFVPGSATAGADFAGAPGTLIFPPGVTEATVSLRIENDALDEADETFAVQLTADSGVTLGQAMATLTIVDNDEPPSVGLTEAIYRVDEGAGAVAVTIALSAPSGRPFMLGVQIAPGTAVAGEDYGAPATPIVIEPGRTSYILQVPITDDRRDEDDETARIILTAPENATLGRAEADLLIIDDDAPPIVGFVSTAYSGEEGAEVRLAVALSEASGKTVRVGYRFQAAFEVFAAPAAVLNQGAGGHTLDGNVLEFAPGETIKEIKVQLGDDSKDEADENLEIELLEPSNATLGPQAVASVTVVDNDIPVVSISGPTGQMLEVKEWESQHASQRQIGNQIVSIGNIVTLTIKLDRPAWQPVTVNFSTEEGTASAFTAGEGDFIAASGTLVFAPGETRKEIKVEIVADQQDESDELFSVRISAGAGAALSNAAVVSITIEANSVLI
jgi:hypothetical protein